jgi:short-subunit dehydrogenase
VVDDARPCRSRRRRVLITGASAGLGRGMALEFAALGCDLALCARRLGDLETLQAEILERHPTLRVAVRTLDVNDHAEVFAVFAAFAEEFGGLDRVIVNAGIGKGAAIGTGGFAANRATAETNFVAALAQCEAAVGIFRAQNTGHLVTIASVASVRGMARAATTYAATKAGLVSLSEGIRADLWRTPIRVTTVCPGYIESDIGGGPRQRPFMVDTATGCRAMVRAIEAEAALAYVPRWPWVPIAFLMRRLPLALLARFV